MKKFLAAGVAVLALSALSITAFAASAYSSPAEAVAALTGKTVESVVEQRQETGDTYGTIANEAGLGDEFKAAMLEMKKDAIAARVASGQLTQERANEILAAIEAKMADCDGTGCETRGVRMGQSNGLGLGNCTGEGLGNGNGSGTGGQNGQRSRMQNDSCVTNG